MVKRCPVCGKKIINGRCDECKFEELTELPVLVFP